MTMKYISTRGTIEPVSFKEAVMMGLARDGGLLLPKTLPPIDRTKLNSWRNLPYLYLAVDILSLFIDDISRLDLDVLVEKSYARFANPQVTPLRKVGDIYVMELFHGPTLAFKDIALQLLGNLFEHILSETGQRMNIIGATSGDTGSAAIYGVRGKENINIFILHPHGRTSPIQALQMTTVLDENVFNLAIRGTFDDAQAIVKEIFGDLEFKDQYHLGAINSINWARVLAQVVYYVYGFCKVWKTGAESVDFSVPTGNFGDIFAGFIAKKLLPEGCIDKLILATNENDILARFVNQGDYSLAGPVRHTSSPSMDIQVASNFERYLYYLRDENPDRVREDMAAFSGTGRLDLSDQLDRVSRDFLSCSVSGQETLATIAEVDREENYLLDPHTAVGYRAARKLCDPDRPVICLATAHPAKFGEAVQKATGRQVQLPPALAGLADKESRCEVMDPDVGQVKEYIRKHALI
jgi:threonine synthase